MLKYTEKDHKDYAKLEEAQGKMKGVAEYVNEVSNNNNNNVAVLYLHSHSHYTTAEAAPWYVLC